jgi:N-methylhydantoinase A
LSSTVAPEIREYERTSTTVANAYVQPLLERDLRTLDEELRAEGFSGGFYPMLSSGNTAPLSAGIEQPAFQPLEESR